MQRSVAQTYRPEHLAQAAAAWGIDAAAARSVGDFENYVYEVGYRGRPAILRVTPGTHQSVEMVRAELDWMSHLGRGGVGVCAAIVSDRGDPVEVVAAPGGGFIAVLFERAAGQRVRRADPLVWNRTLFAAWGATVGRMHRLAGGYTPAGTVARRPGWDEDELILRARDYLPAEDGFVADRLDETVTWLRALPRESDGYGLIHGDVHHGNFFVDSDGRLVIFDFDDAGYHWFAYDIAVSLYHVFPWTGWEPEWETFAPAFLAAFLEGYRKENQLAGSWIAQLPGFLRLRDLIMYINFCKKRDLTALTPTQARFRTDVRVRIENRQPLVDGAALGS